MARVMTEWTALDTVTLLLLIATTLGMIGWAMEYLREGDAQRNRENLCPPHQWEWINDKGGVEPPHSTEHGRFKCKKCHRSPNGLSKGESWLGPF